MKQARVLSFCGLGILVAAGLWAQAAPRELKLGAGAGSLGGTASVPLTLTSDAQVQGFVAAADWDGALLKGAAVDPGAVLASADVVVRRIEPNYFVMGVVMDSDGQDGEIIAPGNGITLATLKLDVLGPPGDSDVTTPLVFQDAKYNSADLGPLLDNIIVVGGLSIGKREGLVLTNGSVTLRPAPPGRFTITSRSGTFGTPAPVSVVMGNSLPVQGFVTAITHPAGLSLNRIVVGSAATAAGAPDFAQADVFATGGTLGVVMELDGNPPFRTIPAGSSNTIAVYEYSASETGCPDRGPQAFDLTFSDNVLGDPVKENVIVIGGRSRNPELNNGTLTLSCPTPEGPGEITFAAGGCELVDDPESGDKDDKIPGPIVVSQGTPERPATFQVGLYYLSPEDDEPDEAQQDDHIQGVSMALCFDPKCILCDETYSLAGTITEAIGAEFVNVHCENDLTDGDPGELIVGILVDALPPFDGQTLPPTETYLKLICVDFHANPEANCQECQASGITFCDGADGRGQVPIRNLASVRNQSVVPKLVNGAAKVTVLAQNAFIRGDCNASDRGLLAVDISDAAAVISFLFLDGTWQFLPPCLSACDSNDDGRVDLADSVFILRYLFKFDRQPKAPFPDPGADPTPDKLDCGIVEECPEP